MGSSDENLQDTIPEFSIDELEEALKKKSGRPTNRTRELRQRLQEANRLKDLLGILDSGILERLASESRETDSGVDSKGTPRVKKDDTPEGFTADLLKRTGFVDDKFLKTNKEILSLSDDIVRTSLVTYGPPIVAIIGGLASIWIAESQINDFPPILHTTFGISINTLKLLATLTKFLEAFGGFSNILEGTNFTTDDGKLDLKKIISFLTFGPIGTFFGLKF